MVQGVVQLALKVYAVKVLLSGHSHLTAQDGTTSLQPRAVDIKNTVILCLATATFHPTRVITRVQPLSGVQTE